MNVKDIYKQLFAGNELEIACGSHKTFEKLRIKLCKENQTARAVELTDLSLCATFNTESGVGRYWLGRKRSGEALEFTVLAIRETDNASGDDSEST